MSAINQGKTLSNISGGSEISKSFSGMATLLLEESVKKNIQTGRIVNTKNNKKEKGLSFGLKFLTGKMKGRK